MRKMMSSSVVVMQSISRALVLMAVVMVMMIKDL